MGDNDGLCVNIDCETVNEKRLRKLLGKIVTTPGVTIDRIVVNRKGT